MNCQRILSTETSLERAYVQMQRNQESVWMHSLGLYQCLCTAWDEPWSYREEGMARVKAASRAGVKDSSSAEINGPGLIFTH